MITYLLLEHGLHDFVMPSANVTLPLSWQSLSCCTVCGVSAWVQLAAWQPPGVVTTGFVAVVLLTRTPLLKTSVRAVDQGRAEEARGRGVEIADGPCRRSLRRIGGKLVPEAVRRQQGEVALAGRLDGIVGRRNASGEAGIELAGVDPSGARERLL